MNKKYFNLLIISALILCNLILFTIILIKPNKEKGIDGPKNVIIEKLGFDEEQIVSYQKLIDQHRIAIKENDHKILSLKKEMYARLIDKKSDAVIDSFTSEIGKIQKQIETIHFNHFLAIRAICKPEQLSNFGLLTKELTDIFNHKKFPK